MESLQSAFREIKCLDHVIYFEFSLEILFLLIMISKILVVKTHPQNR